MQEGFDPNRYAVIHEKNKREIAMLVGQGCAWKRCRFCDYHLDFDSDPAVTFELNKKVLDNVTGIYQKLEIINSGSFVDLEADTMSYVLEVCRKREIKEVHFECHWQHRGEIPALHRRFGDEGIGVKVKIGVETFDRLFRESYLDKGIDEENPARIADYFDECCLLQGIPGQTAESMRWDIETGLEHFERVCVNIMQENGKAVKPDPGVIQSFIDLVLPEYENNVRVDILLYNTAFGVGGVTTNA